MRIPKGKMNGALLKCHGGPWHGKTVLIPTGGTMMFILPFNDMCIWRGFYGHDGYWYSA